MARQGQSNNQAKATVLPNQLVTVAKPMSASQLILTGNKQVLAPIMGTSIILFLINIIDKETSKKNFFFIFKIEFCN